MLPFFSVFKSLFRLYDFKMYLNLRNIVTIQYNVTFSHLNLNFMKQNEPKLLIFHVRLAGLVVRTLTLHAVVPGFKSRSGNFLTVLNSSKNASPESFKQIS